MQLTSLFEDSFEYEGHTHHVDATFDTVLRLLELFEDKAFNNFEKVLIALEMLLNEYELIKDKDFMEQLELYKYLMNEFLNIETDKKKEVAESTEEEEPQEAPPEKKTMDYAKDAGLIYASFLSEYNIDLFEQQGKLHWHKFTALLSYLGDTTAFKQVVNYRTMKVPSTKEASEEYINHVRKMKRDYSLEDEQYKAASMESTLDSIAGTFGGGG